jgi:hypothetical protein
LIALLALVPPHAYAHALHLAARAQAELDASAAELRADNARKADKAVKALASGVSDVVRILEADKAGGDPAALERRREELNNRLSELGRRSTSVQTWASRECGIDL